MSNNQQKELETDSLREKESKRLAEGLAKVAFCRKKHFFLAFWWIFITDFHFVWLGEAIFMMIPIQKASPIDFARDVGGAPRESISTDFN